MVAFRVQFRIGIKIILNHDNMIGIHSSELSPLTLRIIGHELKTGSIQNIKIDAVGSLLII